MRATWEAGGKRVAHARLTALSDSPPLLEAGRIPGGARNGFGESLISGEGFVNVGARSTPVQPTSTTIRISPSVLPHRHSRGSSDPRRWFHSVCSGKPCPSPARRRVPPRRPRESTLARPCRPHDEHPLAESRKAWGGACSDDAVDGFSLPSPFPSPLSRLRKLPLHGSLPSAHRVLSARDRNEEDGGRCSCYRNTSSAPDARPADSSFPEFPSDLPRFPIHVSESDPSRPRPLMRRVFLLRNTG